MEVEPTLVEEPELLVLELIDLLRKVEALIEHLLIEYNFWFRGDLLAFQFQLLGCDPPYCRNADVDTSPLEFFSGTFEGHRLIFCQDLLDHGHGPTVCFSSPPFHFCGQDDLVVVDQIPVFDPP